MFFTFRKNCFRNQEFGNCTVALLRTQDWNHLLSMIMDLVGNTAGARLAPRKYDEQKIEVLKPNMREIFD